VPAWAQLAPSSAWKGELAPGATASVVRCSSMNARLRIVVASGGFGVGRTARGAVTRRAADSPLHDGTPYRGLRVRRWGLGFVHHSRTTLCRPVPNPNSCYDSQLQLAVCERFPLAALFPPSLLWVLRALLIGHPSAPPPPPPRDSGCGVWGCDANGSNQNGATLPANSTHERQRCGLLQELMAYSRVQPAPELTDEGAVAIDAGATRRSRGLTRLPCRVNTRGGAERFAGWRFRCGRARRGDHPGALAAAVGAAGGVVAPRGHGPHRRCAAAGGGGGVGRRSHAARLGGGGCLDQGRGERRAGAPTGGGGGGGGGCGGGSERPSQAHL
jgi:hypothetical protein